MEKQSKLAWTRGNCIGKGSFGTVSLAVCKSDGRVFAVKSVDREACLPNQMEALENEIRILRSLSSPYIVKYLDDDASYESPSTSYRNLHMEYLPGGTVADMATPARRFADVDENILRWHTRCVVSALKYIHEKGIVHCDIKGKNMLLGPDFTSVKLADFGSAMEASGDFHRAGILPRGSPLWMAPEVVRGEYQGPESDVWSLGCTVIEMVSGKPAWEDRGFDSLTRIGYSNDLPGLPAGLSELGRDFLEKCLRRERNQRWSCDQLLQHPFLAAASPPSTWTESSPRCVLDIVNSDFEEDEINTEDCEASARERIGKLATNGGANWDSDGWVAARNYADEAVENCGEGTTSEYLDLMRTEMETGETSSVYSDSVWITEGMLRADSGICSYTSYVGNSLLVEWQSGNHRDERGLKGSKCGLECGGYGCARGCEPGLSCRYGSQEVELAVGRGGMCFKSLCNLLILILCNLRIFRYISLIFFNYLLYSSPFILSLKFCICMWMGSMGSFFFFSSDLLQFLKAITEFPASLFLFIIIMITLQKLCV